MCNMCWVITYPLKAQNFFLNAGKIHLIQSAIAWLLPAVLVGLAFLVDGNYTVIDLGHGVETCGPSSKWTAYLTLILPIQLCALTVILVLVDAGHHLYEVQPLVCDK